MNDNESILNEIRLNLYYCKNEMLLNVEYCVICFLLFIETRKKRVNHWIIELLSTLNNLYVFVELLILIVS